MSPRGGPKIHQNSNLFPVPSKTTQTTPRVPENYDFDWEWDSDFSRKSYKDMRISSANWDKYANFAIAGLIVNRVISVIDVMYLERTGKSTPIQSQIITKGIDDLQLKLSFHF